MAKNKLSGLGRGYEAVFEDNAPVENSGTVLRISEIEPRKDQPRKTFDEAALGELAASIARNGLIQPIVVKDNHTGFYSIIAGERRWRASKLAGLTEVPVIILDVDEPRAAELALIENIQREDLNPVEEAEAYRALTENYGLTQEEVSERVGKSRSTVTNALRLLDLPREALDFVISGDLSAGHARALLSIKDRSIIPNAANTVIVKGMSVRETEKYAKRLNRPEKPAPVPTAEVDYTAELERRMTAKLGRKVSISDTGKQKKLTLEFTDGEDLNALVVKLCGNNIFDED